jgi:hypothetical protein
MLGSATFTIVVSTMIMSWPKQTTIRAAHLLRFEFITASKTIEPNLG